MRSELTRRRLLRGGSIGVAACLVSSLMPSGALANGMIAAIDAVLEGRRLIESNRLKLDLPTSFDYGSTVPLTVGIEGPIEKGLAPPDIHVFAPGNPIQEIASYQFSDLAGEAVVNSRIRLSSGQQQVIALAPLEDGTALIQKKSIKVSIDGCSTEAGVAAGYGMPTPKPRLRAPDRARPDEVVEIKSMISHRMETGLQHDRSGRPIPRHIIHQVRCTYDHRPILTADLHPAVAANAYLGFNIRARQSGVLEISWHEDGGAVYTLRHQLAVG